MSGPLNLNPYTANGERLIPATKCIRFILHWNLWGAAVYGAICISIVPTTGQSISLILLLKLATSGVWAWINWQGLQTLNALRWEAEHKKDGSNE